MSLNTKKLQVLPTSVLLPPVDVYDTYVEIDNDLQLTMNIYNALIAKAHIGLDTGDILRSSFIS